jgi:hypothetical protein
MGTCNACKRFILFGGIRTADGRYCDADCQYKGYLLAIARTIPQSTLRKHVDTVFHSSCPKCHGPGPTDLYMSYRVWSLLVVTSWRSLPQISCGRCGRKAQMTSLIFSLCAGWWGFPFGLILTPIQICRNALALARRRSDLTASSELERAIALDLAEQVVQSQLHPLPSN